MSPRDTSLEARCVIASTSLDFVFLKECKRYMTEQCRGHTDISWIANRFFAKPREQIRLSLKKVEDPVRSNFFRRSPSDPSLPPTTLLSVSSPTLVSAVSQL